MPQPAHENYKHCGLGDHKLAVLGPRCWLRWLRLITGYSPKCKSDVMETQMRENDRKCFVSYGIYEIFVKVLCKKIYTNIKRVVALTLLCCWTSKGHIYLELIFPVLFCDSITDIIRQHIYLYPVFIWLIPKPCQLWVEFGCCNFKVHLTHWELIY